ncbi:hypothetical protein TWF481_009715 [Arthrobotrys musiformis]|uniref:Mid2 domain-containing protein n=1 Tax=Arthrobotrys musiformis TaxID=47236 RepID=A0AAV9W4R2_9PEZI
MHTSYLPGQLQNTIHPAPQPSRKLCHRLAPSTGSLTLMLLLLLLASYHMLFSGFESSPVHYLDMRKRHLVLQRESEFLQMRFDSVSYSPQGSRFQITPREYQIPRDPSWGEYISACIQYCIEKLSKYTDRHTEKVTTNYKSDYTSASTKFIDSISLDSTSFSYTTLTPSAFLRNGTARTCTSTPPFLHFQPAPPVPSINTTIDKQEGDIYTPSTLITRKPPVYTSTFATPTPSFQPPLSLHPTATPVPTTIARPLQESALKTVIPLLIAILTFAAVIILALNITACILLHRSRKPKEDYGDITIAFSQPVEPNDPEFIGGKKDGGDGGEEEWETIWIEPYRHRADYPYSNAV